MPQYTSTTTKRKARKPAAERPVDSIVSEVRRVLHNEELLGRRKRLVVGVSGGPDSVALLHALAQLPLPERPKLIVAHLNHKSRARASDRDEALVKKLARKWGIDCVTESLPKPRGKNKMPSEDSWRNARHQFFKRVCFSKKADALILAHHADDQAETVLMRILRGTGPDGLRAMRVRTVFPGLTAIRPFLSVARSDILSYAKKHRLVYAEDASNSSDRFFRNRIRRRIFPFLESCGKPSVKRSLQHLAAASACDADFFDDYVEKIWSEVCREGTSVRVVLNRKRLAMEHPAVRYRVFRKALRSFGSRPPIGFEHAETLDRLVVSGDPPAVVLPKNLCVRCLGGDVVVYSMTS